MAKKATGGHLRFAGEFSEVMGDLLKVPPEPKAKAKREPARRKAALKKVKRSREEA